MRYCVKCGHELAEGAKFCPSCGHPVEQRETVQPQESMSQKTAVQPEPQAAQGQQQESYQQTVEDDQPQLGFVGSIQYILKHAFEFNGNIPESRKSVFWWGVLGVLILDMVLIFIPAIGWLLGWVADILLVSATMRRLKYINQNPGLGWLLLIPVLTIYPTILMLLDRKGD
ncbi:zinc-ribbon domain-containing protein [Levilactobacillus mulengensis]|uniref:zinc-ribbon domain-containing protein n=1 Tax=Levilactobacillus mulengensis TaxID=2486025 RepID=UPI000F77612E|nr:zinc ribbon domain-containing protein [Levilactobacillus mulengensis]